MVDDEHDVAPLADPLEQRPVHLGDQVSLVARKLPLAEFGEDGPEHLRLGDARIQDEPVHSFALLRSLIAANTSACDALSGRSTRIDVTPTSWQSRCLPPT